MTSFRTIILTVTLATMALGAWTLSVPLAFCDTPVPLIDLRSGTYCGFTGGLYPGGRNGAPGDHGAAGIAQALAVQPRAPNGEPDPQGKVVLLSIGMSNTTQEFCSAGGLPPCDAWTFTGQAQADPDVEKAHLRIVNGAKGGQDAALWTSPDGLNYDRVRDEVLAPAGLDERQVQVIWLKEADKDATLALPSPGADAYVLERHLGDIARAAKVRYPNLQQIFVSSRLYGGYGTIPAKAEPFAYETGFSVKWLIAAQIRQARTGEIDPVAGDLHYTGTSPAAPWIAWGPYLWANGTQPRSDGLIWQRSNFSSDGIHPSMSGERKVGAILLDFFETSRFTRCWFVTGGTCS